MREQEAQHALGVGAMLGEGPVWIDDALWFVDIKAPCIYRLRPETGKLDRWPAPAFVGWVLPVADGGLIAGLKSGLHRFDPADGSFALLAEVEPALADNRLNDATVAPDGTIWFGTMDNLEGGPTGRLYRYDGAVQATDAPAAVVTNGPAVSPDGRTLYLVDSGERIIRAFDLAEGALGAPRTFLQLTAEDGYPDGVICDSAGGVWVALWAGSSARRYDADGALTDVVRFPVSNVTKIAIGGADGRTAFATTARQGLDADTLAREPQAGDLFTFRVDIPGQTVPKARQA